VDPVVLWLLSVLEDGEVLEASVSLEDVEEPVVPVVP
jgi:hypothetical protein